MHAVDSRVHVLVHLRRLPAALPRGVEPSARADHRLHQPLAPVQARPPDLSGRL